MIELYHGSNKKLTILKPQNLHGDLDIDKAVFASCNKTFAMVYAGNRWADRDINQSTYGKQTNRTIVLTEMRLNTFNEIFKTSGYLYKVSGEGFFKIPGRTTKLELANVSSVKPIETVKIVNVWESLIKHSVVMIKYNPQSADYKKV